MRKWLYCKNRRSCYRC